MRSIPTIFCIDGQTHQVINRPLQMVKWVFENKGVATRKYDGVAIKVERGKVYRRYEWKSGVIAPNGFQKVQDFDPKRPHAAIPGWVPVPNSFLTSPSGTDEIALQEAWKAELAIAHALAIEEAIKLITDWTARPVALVTIPDGTYELCGPKIHGNHEEFKTHRLILHGADVIKGVPRTFEGLKKYMETFDGEGIVWHYKTEGGVLMAKIKKRDFGFNTRITKADIEMAYRKSSEEVA